MCFDECTEDPVTEERARTSMELSMRWAERCRTAYTGGGALFGIVQGGVFDTLRSNSLQRLVDIGFDGYALGGLSVGESKSECTAVLDLMATPPSLTIDLRSADTCHLGQGRRPRPLCRHA